MMFSDTYRTIETPAEGLFRDRGSRFIAYAFPVKSNEEIQMHLDALRKEHHGARHHCYAWRLGPQGDAHRSNDDGEPSGTAGKPILNQLLSAGITNVLVVVVRYFGGTLLGVSGLINAYKSAAADAIAHATIVDRHITEVYRLEFPYDAMNAVMKILKEHELPQWNQDFQLECRLEFSVRKSISDEIINIFVNIKNVKVNWIKTE